MFMDAHQPVTLKEGDRYPLGPPSYAVIAPMVEQWTENSCVAGSSPAYGTKFCKCQQVESRCLGMFELPKQ